MAKTTCAVEQCENPPRTRGWCNKHYLRWRRHGNPTATMQPTRGLPLNDRLDRFLDRSGGCWLWTGPLTSGGYGMTTADGNGVLVHRLMYERAHGPIPDGYQLDHLCRVRNCANPDHLEPVTAQVNTLRGEAVTADNARKSHCQAGHLLSGDNLYVRPDGTGRACKTCRAEAVRRYRARKRP